MKIIIFKRRETLKVATIFYECCSIRVIAIFTCNPSLLHRVCCFNPTISVVRALHDFAPGSTLEQDIFGRLPLHDACRFSASAEVCAFVTGSYMAAVYIQDQLGRTPLHYAVGRGFYMQAHVIVALSMTAPRVLHCRDKRGGTPFEALKQRHRKEAAALLRILRPLVVANQQENARHVIPEGVEWDGDDMQKLRLVVVKESEL
jgi:ankyrin repeat protein